MVTCNSNRGIINILYCSVLAILKTKTQYRFLCGMRLKGDNVPYIVGEQNPGEHPQMCRFDCSLWSCPPAQLLAFYSGPWSRKRLGTTELRPPTDRGWFGWSDRCSDLWACLLRDICCWELPDERQAGGQWQRSRHRRGGRCTRQVRIVLMTTAGILSW